MTSILKVDNIQNSSGTAAVTIDGSSNVTIPQNATISGTGTVTGTLTAADNLLFSTANKGVYLGVTSATAANLLDDYEEGTWTPTLVSTSASFQYSVREGFYTKIGRVVNFTCAIQLDGGGNSFTNNSVALNGWPFQSKAGAHSRFFIAGRYLNLDLGNGYTYAYAHLNGDSSSATLNESGDNVPTATIVSNDLSSSSGQLYLHGQYITDS